MAGAGDARIRAVDVRDVADLHVAALETPSAAGERYLATAGYMPFKQIAEILREVYPQWEITRKSAPDWIIKLMARFGGPARQIIDEHGGRIGVLSQPGEGSTFWVEVPLAVPKGATT